MTRNTTRLVRLAGGLITGAIVLTGCSGGATANNDTTAGSSASQTAQFNDADVTFTQGMIVHHQGAIEMAQLADGRAQDPGVLDLASRIKAAQDPEIKAMTGWLEAWGKPTSAAATDSMGGMNHGSGGMGGGMAMDTTALKAASGKEFDRMWLQMMTEHHKGAVDMSKTEIADGKSVDAVNLAKQIVTSQSAEIQEMQTLLTKIGA